MDAVMMPGHMAYMEFYQLLRVGSVGKGGVQPRVESIGWERA